MTSFRVADVTVYMRTVVHMAARKSKPNENVLPPHLTVGLNMCE